MTVRQFGRHLGVSERTVSKWEAALEDIHPRPDMQFALDTALARSTNTERVRFATMLDPAANAVVSVDPVDMNLRISADTTVEVETDPPSVVIRSGGCRLTVIPVGSHDDGRMTRADLNALGKVIGAFRTVGRTLHLNNAGPDARPPRPQLAPAPVTATEESAP